ncbi:MAG: helix-turn-helix transcriptional regulator [Acidovorax temperans]|uniref:helix-turn-helix transcriptional regulator n=1 Tax=Acidovorax temperans TaxID=80878 RepID=UPI00391CE688
MRQALSLIDGAGSLPRRSAESDGVGEDDRLIRLPEVLRLTGMCRSALYNQMALGQFPRSIKIGPRAASWSLNEVRRWIGSRTG